MNTKRRWDDTEIARLDGKLREHGDKLPKEVLEAIAAEMKRTPVAVYLRARAIVNARREAVVAGPRDEGFMTTTGQL